MDYPREKGRGSAARRLSGRDLGHLPVELQVLISCAHLECSQSELDRIRNLLYGEINWPNLIELTERHGLVPLMHLHLGEVSEIVPVRIRQNLAERSRRHAARVLRLTSQLLSVLRELSQSGIPAVPFKGPVLAQQLYGNLGLRQAGDLDILIRPDDFPRAYELLISRGFTPSNPGADPLAVARNRGNLVLELGQDTKVELKSRFTNADIGLRIEFDELQPRLGFINLSRSRVPTFSPADLAILLAVNGARHRWSRLEWLCGYAELWRSNPEIEFERVVATAEELGVRRMVLLALLLAHELLQLPVPADTALQAQSDPWVPRLGRDVQRFWAAGAGQADTEILPMNAFLLHLRDRRSDQLRFILRRAKFPTGPVSPRQQPVRTIDVVLDAVSPAHARSEKSPQQPQDGRSEMSAALSSNPSSAGSSESNA
jgi:hypothetical protein